MEILNTIEIYFLLFMIYSIGGWCVEEVFCSIVEKKIVDRGFLIGPICPIYGFGGLAMTIFLTKFNQSPITVFCMAVFISAILEYFTSYIMEKIFHARWWDYSNEKLNLNGRICINTLIPFGLFGLLLIYILNPFVYNIIEKIQLTALHIISCSFAGVLTIDVIVSMNVVSEVTKKAKDLWINNPKDNTNEITEKVKEELRETVTGSRLVDAFPNFTTLTLKIKRIAEKGKKVVDTSKKKVSETAEKSKEVVKNKAKQGKEKVTLTAKRSKDAVVKKIKDTDKN